MSKKFFLTCAASLFVVSVCAQTDATNLVIMESAGQQITAAELEAELAKSAPEIRNSMLFSKQNMQAFAANVLVRRVMAAEAEKSKLQENPQTAAQLQIAKEKVLSDAFMNEMDLRSIPNPETLLKLANDEYKTNIKKYTTPEQVKASHILITEEQGGERKAAEVLAEIKQGLDFSEAARKYSKDPGSAQRGGDLGVFARGRMVKEFEEAAFSLNIGDVSNLVSSKFGYHIIKLESKTVESVIPFEKVREEIEAGIKAKTRNNARQAYGERVIETGKSYIENLEKYIASKTSQK